MAKKETKINKEIKDHEKYFKEYILIEELKEELPDLKKELPKYSSSLINMASNTSHATREPQVGKISEMIPEYIKEVISQQNTPSLNGWKEYHNEKQPNAVQNAKERIIGMLEKMLESLKNINEEMVEMWILDLLYPKSFEGIMVQLKIAEILEKKGKKVRLATSEEESKNIDIIVDGKNYQVKPTSKRNVVAETMEWDAANIYYVKQQKNRKIVYGVYFPNELK